MSNHDNELDELYDDGCPVECGHCGGPLCGLGYLGFLLWLKCRNCGAEVSHEIATTAEEGDKSGYSEYAGWGQ